MPEKFLGDSYPVGTGKTGMNGTATISMPLSEKDNRPGMPPGFYRVEVTKAGENIPAKYNTATTLGQEIALDNKSMRSGITFDLKDEAITFLPFADSSRSIAEAPLRSRLAAHSRGVAGPG